jgi:4-hydroxy-tetrahydrodipicolinate synthase
MGEIGRLLTAMLTPFDDDGAVDYDAAQRLAQQLCDDGSDGVIVAGTTGESPTLSDDEKVELVRQIRQAIPDKSVVAGTGTYDTHHSVRLSERAITAGADALLAVVPYYSKPPQEGMYQHFSEIAKTGSVIMYNIQGRTGVNMTAATTLRCAQIPNVIGVKEASGDIDQMGLICAGASPGFKVWSGDDSFTLPLLAVGGYGVICVVSHIAGSSMKAMIEAYAAGRNDEARRIHHGLLPVIKALMTTASNPVPIKSVVNALGFPAGPFRLPLVPLPEQELEKVLGVVRAGGDLITFKAGAHVC